jgi:hypothetical protein
MPEWVPNLFTAVVEWTQKTSAIAMPMSAIAACFAAIFSWRSTHIAKQTAKTNLALQIRNSYSSQEMFDSMVTIKHFFETHGDESIQYYLNQKEYDPEDFKNIDQHRRRFVHLYHNIRILNNAGLLDEKIIKKIVMPEEVEFLFKYVEPLDKTLPLYSTVTFDLFQKLFPEINR